MRPILERLRTCFRAAWRRRAEAVTVLLAAFVMGTTLHVPAHAQSPGSQTTLDFKVQGLTDLDLSVYGTPKITVSEIDSWQSGDGTGSYEVNGTLSLSTADMTASLDKAPPTGLDFEVYVNVESGETSNGWTRLGTTAKKVAYDFGGILNYNNEPLDYRARVSAETAPDSYVFTVTYTLVDS